ncbi:MAG TPA: FG-GAP-like repeat-containing protein, partial [Gemmataceae bacterium]
HNFIVTLKDAFGNVATGYTGTVAFTSTDAQASFGVPSFTFTSVDAGTRQFSATLMTDGTQSISARDINSASLTGTQANIAVGFPNVAAYAFSNVPALAKGGTAFTVTITALDRFGDPLPSYNGTANLASSDPYAQFPASVTFTSGVATASVTLFTPNSRTLSATDTVIPSATTSTNVKVFGGTMQPAVVTSEFAAGAGVGPNVTLYDSSGNPLSVMTPFGSGYSAGVRTAVADFNLDGVPDLAVGTGPGVTAEVKVIDGKTGQTLFDVQPFDTFSGGVFVAEGDIKNDGFPDLIVTPDQGGGPRVQIYHGGSFTKFADFFGIGDPGFRGGARAAAGDVTGDGFDDLVVSAGFSGGPRISIYDGAALSQGQFAHPVGDFFAFPDELRNGAYVGVGDINGDGQADLVFGAGPGGGPRTEVVDGAMLLNDGALNAIANPIANFFTGLSANRGGVRESIKNIDGDNKADLVIGDGDLAGSSVRVYKGSDLASGGIGTDFSFDAYPALNAGVFVG